MKCWYIFPIHSLKCSAVIYIPTGITEQCRSTYTYTHTGNHLTSKNEEKTRKLMFTSVQLLKTLEWRNGRIKKSCSLSPFGPKVTENKTVIEQQKQPTPNSNEALQRSRDA
jgi:hypothetical protein